MLEIDVRKYRGQIYVIHDEVVPPSDTESLSEFLRRHNGERIQIDVKIDSMSSLTAVDAQILYGILVEEDAVDKVIVTSKDLSFLRELREIDENIKLGYDPSPEPYPENEAEVYAFADYLEKIVGELGLSFISLSERIAFLFIQTGIAENFVRNMERRGCIVSVWTVNKRENIRKLTSYGFWVTTDLDTL
ncbi:MAG: glycerophosphodiester phosphodiesterase [Candidatus Omnitrophica bacterium]|nr:glycerophosphodiester phosphodiesterase [Candidatus Omnitrophota bacterium]